MPRTCRKPRFLVELGPGQKSDQDTDADKEASTMHGILRSLVSRAGAGGQRVVLRFVLKEYANSMKSTVAGLLESARQTGNTGSSS